nr:MAG TPA: hypothetical protein [Bacteriophage sp.]
MVDDHFEISSTLYQTRQTSESRLCVISKTFLETSKIKSGSENLLSQSINQGISSSVISQEIHFR